MVVNLRKKKNRQEKIMDDYIKCVNCGYKLKVIEKYDDTCLKKIWINNG